MKKEKAVVILSDEDKLKYERIKNIKKRFYRGLIFFILGCIFLGLSIWDAIENKDNNNSLNEKIEEKTTIKK